MEAPLQPSEIVFTMAEAARHKGVSYHTVSRAVRKGSLPAQRLGRQALIRAADLTAWQPMIERRPKKYTARQPDPLAQPVGMLPASSARFVTARSMDSIVELLGQLGRDEQPDKMLESATAALASMLGCDSAAIIEWRPGDSFEVRAAIGQPRDWLAFQDAGPQVITRPIRVAGHPVGLFAGVPAADRAVDGEFDRDLALGLLTLAGVAVIVGRTG
jgi:excisionase family DNA binding protein